MSLLVQSDALIEVGDGNVSIDFAAAAGLPSTKTAVDLAVTGFANFISGTYIQNSADVNEIKSTVTVTSDKVKNASFVLLDSLPNDSGASFSAYGNAVTATKSEMIIDNKSALQKEDGTGSITAGMGSGAWFANLRVYAGEINNVVDGTTVKTGQGIGAVLVQAAGSALFKSLGKNAAISNDTVVEGKAGALATSIKSALDETDATYTGSSFFRRYLDSGRYAKDNGDVDGTVSYNLKKANFDFMVKLTGAVSDPQTALTEAIITRVLGTSGSDHKVDTSSNEYTMNIFVRLQQRNDL